MIQIDNINYVDCSVEKCSFNYNCTCTAYCISLDDNGRCDRIETLSKRKRYKVKRKKKGYQKVVQDTIPQMPTVNPPKTSSVESLHLQLDEDSLKFIEDKIEQRIVERLKDKENRTFIPYTPKYFENRFWWQSPQITCNTTSVKEIKSWISSGQLPPLQNNKIASLGRTN